MIEGAFFLRLQDKVVLVTAATRGIGLATVTACAEEGAVVYMAARNEDRAREAVKPLLERGLRVRYVYNDASVPESFGTMVEDVIALEGRLDVLVNNFGTSDPTKDLDFSGTSADVFLETVTMNLRSVFLAGQAAVLHMRAQGGGSIVNISSVGGVVPDLAQVSYGTSKAAINYLTKLIAVQEARYGIRCNAVAPGMTATEAVATRLGGEFKGMFLRHVPLHRMASPKEIADAVVYFASEESAYTTGQILTVSGGFGLATPLYGDFADRSRARAAESSK